MFVLNLRRASNDLSVIRSKHPTLDVYAAASRLLQLSALYGNKCQEICLGIWNFTISWRSGS